MKKKSIEKITNRFLTFVPLLIFIVFILFPFYWTLVTAFKSESDIIKRPIKYFPNPVTFKNFTMAWKNVGFSIFFKNSLIVSLLSVILITLCSVLVGYSLSRFKFAGKNFFMLILLCTQFIPSAMLVIPLFIIFKKIGLINNMLSLILVYTTFELPFNSIIMKGFISGVPYELEEASMIDGCNQIQAIWYSVIPVLLPGIVATSVFAFVGCWNEFLYALMFINKKSLFTISVGLKYMMGEFSINYGALAAGSIIAVVPVIIMFAYIQKYLVSGLSAGAVKG